MLLVASYAAIKARAIAASLSAIGKARQRAHCEPHGGPELHQPQIADAAAETATGLFAKCTELAKEGLAIYDLSAAVGDLSLGMSLGIVLDLLVLSVGPATDHEYEHFAKRCPGTFCELFCRNLRFFTSRVQVQEALVLPAGFELTQAAQQGRLLMK